MDVTDRKKTQIYGHPQKDVNVQKDKSKQKFQQCQKNCPSIKTLYINYLLFFGLGGLERPYSNRNMT